MKRREKSQAPPGQEINPYVISATERAPRRHMDRAGVGAVMVFVATVIGPCFLIAFQAFVSATLLATSGHVHALDALFGVTLVVGAFRVTAALRIAFVSDWLGAATRLSTVAHAATLALIIVTFARGDGRGYHFFKEASDFTRVAAEALLALTAGRHFGHDGSRVAARAGRWLAAAMPAAMVAESVLMRATHDDLFRPVPPQYAYLVVPINLAVWIWKLVVFGMLCQVLMKRSGSTSSPRGAR
jgi:hypothetical protein